MLALSDVAAIIIAAGATLAVLILGLAVLSRRGRNVRVHIDVGEPEEPDESEVTNEHDNDHRNRDGND